MDELTLAVVGVRYPNADKSNRRFEVELCAPGDAIELRPEPKHKLDRRAIGMWRVGGGQMGYITAERAGLIGQRLQAEPVVAVFQGFDGVAAYIRVRFGGGAPHTLPPPPAKVGDRESGQGGDDFFPDPDGPDWGA